MAPPPSWKPGVCGSTPGAGRGHGVLGGVRGIFGAPGELVSPFSELQMVMIESEADGQNER